MSRFTRIAAVAAAAASLAAASAAPASAQTLQADTTVCYGTVTVPSCVNYTLDVANRAVQYAQETYDREVQPQLDAAACTVIYLATGRRCP